MYVSRKLFHIPPFRKRIPITISFWQNQTRVSNYSLLWQSEFAIYIEHVEFDVFSLDTTRFWPLVRHGIYLISHDMNHLFVAYLIRVYTVMVNKCEVKNSRASELLIYPVPKYTRYYQLHIHILAKKKMELNNIYKWAKSLFVWIHFLPKRHDLSFSYS